MTAHSTVVGGSTAARRIGCPASYKLEARLPPGPNSVYAQEGTALHELMRLAVGEGKEPLNLLPFTHSQDDWSYTVTQDIWDRLGEPALAAFDKFLEDEGIPPTLAVIGTEERVDFPGIEGAFGTADVSVLTAGTLYVIDWKFGSHIVKAEKNAQLQFYAAGLRGRVSGKPESVVYVIIQPANPDGGIDVWRSTSEELDAYIEELTEAVKEATESENPRSAIGRWCDFATCRAICPARLNAAKELAKLKSAPTSDEVNYAALLELAELVKPLCDAVYAMAHSAATEGVKIPGWALVAKRSAGREWALGEKAIAKLMRQNRVCMDVWKPRKMITMPAAETLFKKLGSAIPEEYISQKESSGTNLVRAEKAVNTVEPVTDRIQKLAEQLNRK